jgi:hypothetical protein
MCRITLLIVINFTLYFTLLKLETRRYKNMNVYINKDKMNKRILDFPIFHKMRIKKEVQRNKGEK